MKKVIVLLVVGVIILFLAFEKGEKTLSYSELEHRLVQGGFEIEVQDELLLYPDQEELFPEIPETTESIRLRHPDIGSDVVTAAYFSNEKIPLWLEGKTNGFPARNWFFFGIINKAMTREVQDALKLRDGETEYRFRVSDAEIKALPAAKEKAEQSREALEEEVLTREEVLERFRSAGLTINRIEEDKGMPKSVERKLPATPLDDFLLFIEKEGVFPIEFETAEDAIEMHRKYKKGFRHGNWYFPGQITSELRKKLIRALQGEA